MRLKIIVIISFLLVTVNANSQIRDLIIGNWVFKDAYNKEQIDEAGLEMLDLEIINKMSFNFKSNGKFVAYMMGEKANGRWGLTEDFKGIRLDISGENSVELAILKLTKDELALKLGLGEFLMERGKGKSRKKKSSKKKEKIVFEINPNKNIEINESELFLFDAIEKIPMTSECNENLSKVKLKECVRKSINIHIARKFNADLASDLGLASKRHEIITTFIIDTNGEIINVHSEGSHPILNDEASRVLSILPNMKPGIKDGKAINVKYTNIIRFSVE
ncbi:MAG: energy transducer TonB [Flavobacteriaceae bacterium]